MPGFIAIRSNRMATLRENFYKNRGLGINPLVEGLVKENEFDLPGDTSTPEATDDFSSPLSMDTLPPEIKQQAEESLANLKHNMSIGVKVFIRVNGKEVPIEKAVASNAAMKAEYEKLSSEDPAASYNPSNFVSIVQRKDGKKRVGKLPIPIVSYILDNLNAPAASSMGESDKIEEISGLEIGLGAGLGVVGGIGAIALGIWAWNKGKEVASEVGEAIGSGLDTMAKNAQTAKKNAKIQAMLKRFDGDATFQKLVSSLKATPYVDKYKTGAKDANNARRPNIKALKEYIESKLTPEEKGWLTALYDAAQA
jgi:hypothetical protein